MDKFIYTTEDEWEITLAYDSSSDDTKIVKDIKSLMESMIVRQVRDVIRGEMNCGG